MTSNKKPGINLDLLWSGARRIFDALSEQAQAEYLGFGKGSRRHFDVPEYITLKDERVVSKGNSFIVFGLDRPSNILSGYGGTKDTHSAAIDIVAGRLGHYAIRRDNKGDILNVDPNFKLDAARIYISQKADVDSYFGLAAGNVGNTSNKSPRSTVALKADTVRIIGRENIKLVTRTDMQNSQGGNLTNASTQTYGIDLIAMNDTGGLQPLVKGTNLQKCLTETVDGIHDLREVFKNFLQYNRTLTQALMNHTHRSPFYGQLTSPDFEGLLPKGGEALVNVLTNVEAQLMLHMQKLSGIKQNYLDTPGGAEATEDDEGLFILSKYNSTN
tara:strand:+ start:621 stop:1607 length:987 start_codon:yes stop_codon:yes gene_type:complete